MNNQSTQSGSPHFDRSRTCEEIEHRIHQLLDDRLTLTGDGIVMDHAATCGPCAQLVQDYEEVSGAFPAIGCWPEESSRGRSGFNSRVLNSRVFDVRLHWISALAAGLLLAIGLSLPRKKPTDSLGSARITPTPPASSAASLAVARLAATQSKVNAKAIRGRDVSELESSVSQDRLIRKLVFYQPPTFVELAKQTPELVNSVKSVPIPSSDVWHSVSGTLHPINPYLQYTGELPGIRQARCSVSMTLEILQRSFSKVRNADPELGWFPEPSHRNVT